MLVHADVARYLLNRRLVDASAIVDSDLVVLDASSRHRNYRVVSRAGPSYFLKHGPGRAAVSTVAREAAAYEQLVNLPGAGRFVPQLHLYDPDEDLLVLELVKGRDLRSHHTRHGRFSTAVAAALGTALGTLHRDTALAAPHERGSAWKPWVLEVHRPNLDSLRDFSAANVAFVKVVQQFEQFGRGLDALADEWSVECVIHNDVKLDNCIVPDSPRGTVRLVDWELSTEGDPCWDIGSVFSHYLSFWLLSIPVTGEAPPERWPELARYPLARIRPALAACWRAYCAALEVDADEAATRLERSIRFAAARLLQTGMEQTQFSLELSSTTICLLQLGLNVLRRPEEAALTLLGLPYSMVAGS